MIVLVDLAIAVLIFGIGLLIFKAAVNLNKKDDK